MDCFVEAKKQQPRAAQNDGEAQDKAKERNALILLELLGKPVVKNANKHTGKRLHSDIEHESTYARTESFGVTISTPATVQITNYNICPPPVVTFSKPVPRNLTICVELVPEGQDTVINSGFVQGDIGVIKAGYNRIEFPNLKLNKMTPIRADIKNCKQPIRCQMKFLIESESITSSAFTLRTNTSQITDKTEKAARPKKKVKPTNETMVDTSAITFNKFIPISTSVTTSVTRTVCTSQGDWNGDEEDGGSKLEEETVGEGVKAPFEGLNAAALWIEMNDAIDRGDSKAAGNAARQLAEMRAPKRQKTLA